MVKGSCCILASLTQRVALNQTYIYCCYRVFLVYLSASGIRFPTSTQPTTYVLQNGEYIESEFSIHLPNLPFV
ncbi:MAG: hypothetical protein QNJ74_26940 [Trichodesmium sp. MO_231.B1]|nr:hypothetical protein [Trichodesmium sp. MO_231.B1]